MEQASAAAHSPELETTTGLDHRKMVMWAFLGSECLFFGTLISTYLVYRNKSLVGPYPDDIINVPVTSVSTFVLLMSSFMMVMTLAAINRGDDRAFRVWVLGTALLGSTFLGFQVFEFREFWLEGLTPRTNLFGTTFFVLTGFHGAHVTVGVIWLVSLFGQSLLGNLKQKDSLRVEMAGLYWHFVDIVWIVIFTLVYLIAGTDAPEEVGLFSEGLSSLPIA
ncbi:MAG: heme-copper oxidase subunit III [Dehalococcoidia bacterium]